MTRAVTPEFDLTARILSEIMDWPEIARAAGPGETLDGHDVAPEHYLIQMWPLLKYWVAGKVDEYGRKTSNRWQLTPPCIYDIDTTASADDAASAYMSSLPNHWARPIHLIDPLDGAGHPFCAWKWIGGAPNGALCRGDAIFSNNPLSCALELRAWAIQSWGNGDGNNGHFRTEHLKWWREHGSDFFMRHMVPYAIIVPNITVNDLSAAYRIRLTESAVEALLAGNPCPLI